MGEIYSRQRLADYYKKRKAENYNTIDADYLTSNDLDIRPERMYQNWLDSRHNDGVADRCYRTSNEYLMQYFSKFDLQNKRVMTVGSSGDQLLNALYYGSREVTYVDLNIFSKAYIEYKIALIRNLNYDDFVDIFTNYTNIFSWHVYSRISHDLSLDSKMFFDGLMLEMDPDESVRGSYEKFTSLSLDRGILHGGGRFNILDLQSEFYESKEAYNRLKYILLQEKPKITFKIADFLDFPVVLENETYDYMFLSNIHDYIQDPREFDETLRLLYDYNLKPGGYVQVDYDFSRLNYFRKKVFLGRDPITMNLVSSMIKNTHCSYFLDKPKEKNTNEENLYEKTI